VSLTLVLLVCVERDGIGMVYKQTTGLEIVSGNPSARGRGDIVSYLQPVARTTSRPIVHWVHSEAHIEETASELPFPSQNEVVYTEYISYERMRCIITHVEIYASLE
jgi:hypothetical protein